MKKKINYEQFRLMILFKAHSFHRTTGHDLGDLISQGNLIYCEAIKSFDPKRAKFSTFLHHKLTKGLYRYTIRQAKHRRPTLPINEGTASTPPKQFRQHLFYHNLSSLTNEAQDVIYTILYTPKKLFGRDRNQRKLHKRIVLYLRRKGLSWPKTKKILNSIWELAYNKCEGTHSTTNFWLPARNFGPKLERVSWHTE